MTPHQQQEYKNIIPTDRKWTLHVTDEDGCADIWEKGYTNEESELIITVSPTSSKTPSRIKRGCNMKMISIITNEWIDDKNEYVEMKDEFYSEEDAKDYLMNCITHYCDIRILNDTAITIRLYVRGFKF